MGWTKTILFSLSSTFIYVKVRTIWHFYGPIMRYKVGRKEQPKSLKHKLARKRKWWINLTKCISTSTTVHPLMNFFLPFNCCSTSLCPCYCCLSSELVSVFVVLNLSIGMIVHNNLICYSNYSYKSLELKSQGLLLNHLINK